MTFSYADKNSHPKVEKVLLVVGYIVVERAVQGLSSNGKGYLSSSNLFSSHAGNHMKDQKNNA